MNELSIALGVVLAGFCVAWYLRGWRAHAQLAPLRARLESLEQQHAERAAEFDALCSDRTRIAELYRGETERRAAAEQRASRVEELEVRLEQRDGQLAQSRETIAALETQLREERRALELQRASLKEAQLALSDSFKALSADALKSKSFRPLLNSRSTTALIAAASLKVCQLWRLSLGSELSPGLRPRPPGAPNVLGT